MAGSGGMPARHCRAAVSTSARTTAASVAACSGPGRRPPPGPPPWEPAGRSGRRSRASWCPAAPRRPGARLTQPVGVRGPEDRAGPGGGPRPPALVAVAGEAGVRALPERGVCAQRQHRGQPDPHPVQHPDPLFQVRHRDVDVEEGVGVLDPDSCWLPTVLALSANSPFWRTEHRLCQLPLPGLGGVPPTTGPSAIFGSAHAYQLLSASLLASSLTLDTKMLYFDTSLFFFVHGGGPGWRTSPWTPSTRQRSPPSCARWWDPPRGNGAPPHAPDPATSDLLRVWIFPLHGSGVSGELVKRGPPAAQLGTDGVAELLRHIHPFRRKRERSATSPRAWPRSLPGARERTCSARRSRSGGNF